MDNALVPALPSGVARPADGVMARLTAVPVKAMVMLTLGVAALAAVIAALAMWSKGGDYRVLYANLSDKDGGAIVSQLSQMNVPYRHADGGNAILVPADKVHDVRLRLAQAGLPRGSSAGFELLDNARFGQTQFQERLTWQRALEGELVRSISSLAAVQSARVHLALPQQNGFFREQQKPSASVLVQLHAGRTLERAQVAGIVHLVSSSVPELSPKAVSVLDSSGTLLSGGAGDPASGLDAQQLQYVQQIEASYVKRVLEIIEPIVGRDNVRATVAADVDFAQSEATDELYKPNQGRDASVAVRSQQSSESSNGPTGTPSGIPGALSNQPPVPATAPIAGASAPLQAAGGAGSTGSTRRDNVVNYEVDKTVRVTRNATGIVKRLNAAVVVNHRVLTDARGKTTSTPLSSDEIEKLTALVRESIGFNQARGDSVKLINVPFRTEPAPKAGDALPLWQQPWLIDLVRAAAVPAALVLVALLVIAGVIKPALKSVAGPSVGRQLDAVVADAPHLPAPASPPALAAPAGARQLADARELAKQNPAAVAHIVRGWVNEEKS
ncbi:MAG: flagellar M-ring protein FliF [Burkholderiaceae bacterium]|nr:flagellar M-ring protein FliF [Ideonella sp.]MCC7284725.1 flagellar M-ring protein FliF [Burkholderiaceae bacterium]